MTLFHSLKPTKIQSFQLSFSYFPIILLLLLFSFLITKTSANSENFLDLDKINEQGIHIPDALSIHVPGPLITRIHAMEVVFLQLTVTETLTEK